MSAADAFDLAAQEGFAGRLIHQDGIFEWARTIDYQVPIAARDRATLAWHDDVLVESGHHVPYIEHWHRDRGRPPASWGVRLHDAEEDRSAILVVASDRFAYARTRGVLLDANATLADVVSRAPTTAAAQDLVDCEISIGSVNGWHIERSTLPWRAGTSLAARRTGARLSVGDLDAQGRSYRRHLTIVEQDEASD